MSFIAAGLVDLYSVCTYIIVRCRRLWYFGTRLNIYQSDSVDPVIRLHRVMYVQTVPKVPKPATPHDDVCTDRIQIHKSCCDERHLSLKSGKSEGSAIKVAKDDRLLPKVANSLFLTSQSHKVALPGTHSRKPARQEL